MSPRSTARTRTATVCALLVVAGAATVVAFSGVAAAGPAGMAGSGTPGDPYVVTNATQLQAINESLGDHYVLGNDIDASGTSTWNGGEGFVPIGADDPFTGELDGYGHTVSGLYINESSGSNAALFYELDGGTVTRVGIVDANVTAGDGADGEDGTTESTSYEVLKGHDGQYGGRAAGLVAFNHGSVTDSFVVDSNITSGDGGDGGDAESVVAGDGGTYSADGGDGAPGGDAGGIVARNYDTVSDTYVAGTTITAGTGGSGGSATGLEDDGSDGSQGPSSGIIGNDVGGSVADSYVDTDTTSATSGSPSSYSTGLSTAQMTGATAENNMDGFDWDYTWKTRSSDYPNHQTAPSFEVEIVGTNAPVNESETLEVSVDVTNTRADSGTKTVTLSNFDDQQHDSQSLTLDGAETSSITLEWTTQTGDAGTDDVTVDSGDANDTQEVTVQAPANFSVTIDDTNAPVAEGEDLLVNATVENTGDVQGTQDITLKINDTIAATETVTIGGGSTAAVNFTNTTADGDAPALAVNVSSENASAETTATVQRPANFSVAITGTNSPVTEGDALTVDVNVTNVGEATATKSVNLSDVDGSEVDSVPVTLAGGGSNTSVALNWSTAAGDAGTGSVTVASPDATNSTQVTVQTTANFSVAITGTNSPVAAGDPLTVDVNVTNVGEAAGTQLVNLSDVDGDERDNVSVTLTGGASNDSITLTWDTAAAEAGTGTVTVASPNASATASVSVNDTTAPTADAGANQTLDEDVRTSFNGTATDAVGVTGYAWDYDDGNTSSGQNATHAFATPGTYTVTFNASDAAGNAGTDTLSVTVNDTTAPIADAGANRSVQEDTAVSFDGSASTDNAGVVAYNWSFGDGATTTGTAPSHTYASPGTYTVTLNVSDAAGHAANDTLVVTVRAAPAGGGGGGVGGGGGGAVGGPRIIVEPIGATGGGVVSPTGGNRVSIENAVAEEPLSIEVGGTDEGTTPGDDVSPTAPDAGNIVVDRIDVTPLRDGDFELAVETREVEVPELQTTSADGSELSVPDLSTDALGDAGQAFVGATGRRPAGFLRVDHAFPDDDVGDVALQFRVRKSYLSVAGVAPGAVQLYREEPEGWRALPTQQIGETDEFYRFSADSPGLSRFTIGAAAPVFEVEVVRPADVGRPVVAGETATVAVTVSNVGSADGRFTGVLSVDGGGPVRDSVSVPTGTSRTLELHPAFRRAGTVELALNGRAVASVDVLRAAASGDGPGPPAGEPTPADDASTGRPAPGRSVVEATDSAPAWVVFAVTFGIFVALVVSNTTLRRMDE